MRITDIRIIDGDGVKVLARISVVIDDMIAVHGLAIMPGHNGGFFLAMPRHKRFDGTYRDTMHPINAESRKYLERKVFDFFSTSKKPVKK